MAEEIESDELQPVFAALDDEALVSPPYADRLWSELELTLSRDSSPSSFGDDVIDLDGVSSRRERVSRRWLGMRIASAAAAAAAVAFFVLSAQDRSSVGTVDVPPPGLPATTLPVLTDPVAACGRYFASDWSIERLIASDLTDANFDRALDALDRLRLDLDASGEFSSEDLDQLAIARGAVLQAKLEVDEALLDRAKSSLSGVADQIALGNVDGSEPRCAPVDE